MVITLLMVLALTTPMPQAPRTPLKHQVCSAITHALPCHEHPLHVDNLVT
jgi:hypothetical protein